MRLSVIPKLISREYPKESFRFLLGVRSNRGLFYLACETKWGRLFGVPRPVRPYLEKRDTSLTRCTIIRFL